VFTDTRRFVDFVTLSPDDRLCKTVQIPDPVTALVGDLELFLIPAIAPVFVDMLIEELALASISQGIYTLQMEQCTILRTYVRS
jgi:hypothetical protein